MDDNRDDGHTELPINPQLIKAFKNLCDHALSWEEYATFLTDMEKKGHKHDDVAWDFTY